MDRHATHRDILALVVAAFGQSDIERGRSDNSIVEKKLVEITHAVEQQVILMLFFDRQILRHHWRHGRFAANRSHGFRHIMPAASSQCACLRYP